MSDEKNAGAGEMTAEAFLDVLSQKDLVPKTALATLRKQVAEAKGRVSARQVAKLLVDKGVLTPGLAQRLLAVQGSQAPKAAPAAPLTGQPPKTAPAATLNGPDPKTAPVAALKGQQAKTAPKTPPAAPAPVAGSGLASLLDEELGALPEGLPPLAAGPLDALANDPILAAAVAQPSPLAMSPAPKRRSFLKSLFRARRGGPRRRARRLPWARIGVAAAAILLVVAVTTWALTRPNPDKLLQPADALYENGSFADAIQKYDEYLDRFPALAASGRARVRRGLARLRLKFSEPPDDSIAMQTAAEVLPAISSEAEFDEEARAVLAALLPPVAEGLALRARKQSSPASLAEAQQMLSLADRYTPVADKPLARLGRVEASLALTGHKVAGDDEIKQAIAAIGQAVAAKDYQAAYRVRTTLLGAYPGFSARADLADAVLGISKAEQAAVAWVAKHEAAEKAPPASPLSTVILAERTVNADASGAKGHVIFAVAGGVVYGLDAANGAVLWRSFVGFGADGLSDGDVPKAVASQPAGDVVLAAASHREVRRVEAATGRLVWRHAIADPFRAEPVIGDGQVLVATLKGRLVTIDAASGDSTGFVQLPQPLGVAPALDSRRKLLFQVAEHDNLFVLAMPGGRCCQAFPLGHRPGTVVAPPVLFGDCLLVAVNDTAGDCSLEVLKIDAEEPQSPAAVLGLAQTIPLHGHVDAAPSVADQRLLVATDAGEVLLFEAAPAGAKGPLREVARARRGGGQGCTAFPLLQGEACLLGDERLTSFEIQPSKKQLAATWSDASQGAVCHAPLTIGQTVFCVRRVKDLPGVVASAVTADRGQPYWQTRLAAPLATAPAVDPQTGKITAVTALGGVFQLEGGTLGAQAVADQPVAAPWADLSRPVSAVVRFSGDRLALCCGEGCDQVAVFDPGDPREQLRGWLLPGALGCPPIAFAGGLLAPSRVGQVYWLEPLSGKGRSGPFQPRLRPGELPAWREPVPVGDKEIVISDGRTRLYRLHVVDQPVPHLEAAGTAEVSAALVSPLATVGKVVCAVDAAGKLDVFQLPGLARVAQHDLSGRCQWGPRRVGDRVMLATDDGRLYCFDQSCQLVWQVALPYGPLAGAPLAVGDHYFLAAGSGFVWRADAAGGKELGKVDTGQPLATGPVLLGKRILLGGHDGSLHHLAPP
ncbi:MAG: PQQ-binding-like beta-propeller repeat protein [Thermoguttaceae bacterium]